MPKSGKNQGYVDWSISSVEMQHLLNKWAHNESDMTVDERTIRIMEIVMKEKYGPEIEKMFDELAKELDSAIGHHGKAGQNLDSMKSILDRYRGVADED